MFARGGRLAVAAVRRQLQVSERRVAVPATLSRPDWTSASSPSCMRRDNARSMTTEVIGGSASEERRRLLNRILYRSRQRGYLELDLLLGKWATDNIEQLDDQGLVSLVAVLDEENPNLLSWITGQVEAPEDIAKNPVFLAIHKQVSALLNEHSSIETRAKAGQPWVRGWDDNRKIGGPQIGNQ
ncbi:unnamed protein product [Calypogeia fissa]